MKSNHLLLLALKKVREHVGEGTNTFRFLTSELGLLRSIQGIADVIHFIPMEGQPYRLTEGRVVFFRAGTLRLRINLCEEEFKAGDLLAVSPGTVFEFLYVSPDLDLAMLAFSNSLMENWQKEDLLQTYLQGRLFLHLSLTAKEVQRMEQLFALLWEVVHDRPFPRASVQSLISLCFHQLDFVRKSSQSTERQQHTRQEEVFNRFLELVNKYAARERTWSLSDCLSMQTIRMIAKNLAKSADGDVPAGEQMAYASYITGMAYSNVGLGLVHGMAHPLGGRLGVAHGVANGILLAPVMEYNKDYTGEKYRDIADAFGIADAYTGDIETVREEAVQAVHKLTVDLKNPTKISEVGATEADLEPLAHDAFHDVCTPGNPRQATQEDILAIYKSLM